ncbi:GNAT family N-acetyltransferase [Nocardia cyriacigeorgica]|uniref:GNAT family N-acetyltransferase n=2 Tax=Nocardia cyriacigeorgica TaxID=135487 RepID=A0A6P1D819_9NOCA|nr:GNAT family N-acetyltransferase [Nocardia cyriacigeorgica]NEW45671.1 GNAT family N-acetyltransferase [Nocardia cyriacigeorgica]NEW51377.1 GNAT family N-acetyltransferase [Nocardia cyriacigeorgica]NEW55386.1 GNAT family N-acetyltransferase [Nocardia cyriacigeorgica]
MSAAVDAAHFTSAVQPVLVGDGGMVVRPWIPSDAEAVFVAFQDEAIQRWHVRTAESVGQVRDWIERWRSVWSAGNAQWAITCGSDLAGRIGLRKTDLAEGVTEIAYWTTPEWRGRAIAPRAANLVTQWAFDDIGFERIELTHSIHNPQSCRVASKCGYLLEGTMRAAGRHSDGRHDMHLHARLRAD